jgi:DHA1 family tetracycline resistance protein-like MFS transporter
VSSQSHASAILSPVRRVFVAAFVMDLAAAMIGLSVQFLGHKLEAPPLILGLLGMSSAAAYAISCLFSGRLSDRFGRKTLVVGSCLICAGAWLAMPYVTGYYQLLAILPISGAAASMFWPPMQAWLSEITVGGRRRLVRNIGNFNIAWTAGLMIGPPIAGVAWALGAPAPFILAALSLLGVLIMTVRMPASVDGGGENVAEDFAGVQTDGDVARRYLHLAWIANFASWFGRGMQLVVFPKQGADLGMSEGTIGLLVGAYLAGQLLMFLYLRNRSGWQFRLWPLLASLAAGAAGWLIAWQAQSIYAFAAAFILAGMGAGVTYASSLFYSLRDVTGSRGAQAGIHEAVLGSGVFLGPLFGGAVAGWAGIAAPYLLTTVIFIIFGGLLFSVWRSTVRPVILAAQETLEAGGE